MILLAVDTSTPRAAIALGLEDGSIQLAACDPLVRHGRALLSEIRHLLRDSGLKPADLSHLAVGLGPGSYTGLRVGVTAVKTLAYALDRPMIGLDSLEVIAGNAPDEFDSISVLADAQRGDFYVGDFIRDRTSRTLRRLVSTQILAESAFFNRSRPETLVIGPGVAKLSKNSGLIHAADDPIHLPDPETLIAIARTALDSGRRDEPWFLEPAYLRRSAAEDQWDARRVANS